MAHICVSCKLCILWICNDRSSDVWGRSLFEVLELTKESGGKKQTHFLLSSSASLSPPFSFSPLPLPPSLHFIAVLTNVSHLVNWLPKLNQFLPRLASCQVILFKDPRCASGNQYAKGTGCYSLARLLAYWNWIVPLASFFPFQSFVFFMVNGFNECERQVIIWRFFRRRAQQDGPQTTLALLLCFSATEGWYSSLFWRCSRSSLFGEQCAPEQGS